MSAFPKTKSFGFSLVELMFAIVILAVLVGIAMPSFSTWLRNSQIRNAAESIANGLQRARAEAVARNTSVAFVLATDSSWTVDYVVKPVAADPPIDSRSSSEGSRDVTRTVLPAGATTVTFNNLGQVTDATPLAQVDFAAVGGNRNLRVTIGVGGNARMCDPNLISGSSPSAC